MQQRPIKNLPAELCRWEDFVHFMPSEISLARLLSQSRSGTFAKACRPEGRKGQPVFRKADVLSHFKLRFEEFFPDRVNQLAKHWGMNEEPCKEPFKKKPKQKKIKGSTHDNDKTE